MGQRHQSRRRRAYGRRQHEIRERRLRADAWDVEIEAPYAETGERGRLDELFGRTLRFADGVR